VNLYLVSKGWEGFCDRLQCLSHCVTLALKHERVLYVDWDDRIWNHGEGGFHRYFDLVDICHVTSARAIPPGMDVFPPFWSQRLGTPGDEWIHDRKDELVVDLAQLNAQQPVWVHAGVGFRAYDFDLLQKHLRLSAAAAAEVAPLLHRAGDDLPTVHLRGTDRAVSQTRWDALRAAAPVAYVVSDDQRLAARWMKESPQSVLLSNTLVAVESAGHKLAADALQQYGLTKHAMNIRLIADFLILARAREAHALNGESVFFAMARLFGACGGVDKLLQPAPAAFKVQGAWIRPTIPAVQEYLASQQPAA